MKKMMTLADIAGYATERTVWQMLANLSANWERGNLRKATPESIIIEGCSFKTAQVASPSSQEVRKFHAPETFGQQSGGETDRSEVWTIGALAFYAVIGTHVFEAKGGETQTPATEVPHISSTHASHELSTLIYQCLSYAPSGRPTMSDINHKAKTALAEAPLPRKRLTAQSGKGYASSIVKFWPEEMAVILLLVSLLIFPSEACGQSAAHVDIPTEMYTLVQRCETLRDAVKADKVRRDMDRDMSWTMMDEIAVDKAGECSTKDPVDMLGLNDIGFSILKRRGGITNSGGRFRDGRDPRYKYSFIEITVKKGAQVNYVIDGREGQQLFAIVPFNKNANFSTSININNKTKEELIEKDGVNYIQIKQDLAKSDKLKLTISNNSGQNAAFAIINYNSRHHE